ncbi:hypothetical protein [Pseudalkalibacillus caeni]|uniref:Uncharacterized protein n=1 Tax=Exobacillus caeni TaxID=2574798 RepID=A0A5R9F5D3_9BACL|nr:hypothetical protein [Pseudalkalibacillus caeni]TLS37610.1 hypothetical protein FCL54_10755 [Pseudalkalibacillus caeni]
MALKSFFNFLIKESSEIQSINKKLDKLLEEIKEQEKKNKEKTEQMESINVEQVSVDKLIIEKLEYTNNFGALGIKELKGKLNIGATYENLPLTKLPKMPEIPKGFTPIEIQDKKPESNLSPNSPPPTPKYEIRARKEKNGE